MPVRFRTTRPDNDDRQILSDVPAPALPDYRRCGLAQALVSVLGYCDQTVDYSLVMGLTGLAFAIRQTDSLTESAPLVVPPEYVVAGLQALGHDSQVLANPALSTNQLMEAVKREIDAGRPAVAYGWGPGSPTWSVIAGYESSQELLYGYPLRGELQPALEALAQADLLVCLGEGQQPSSPPVAVQEAVGRTAELWTDPPPDTGPAAYRNLLALLEDGAGFGGDFPEVGIAAHETLIANLIDSRGAAIDFLQSNADLLPAIPAAWLQQAADLYRQLVELLETRSPPVFDPLTADALSDAQWRRGWSQRLEQVAELDINAAATLRRALSAEFPPDGE